MKPLTPAELRAALEASPMSPALVAQVMATVESLELRLKRSRESHLATIDNCHCGAVDRASGMGVRP